MTPEISLHDLVREGYLKRDDVRAFEGIDVAFSSSKAGESNPQMILARAHMPDGQTLVLLNDGSVQGFSRKMSQRLLDSADQPGTAPNAVPPPR